jgi:hypothetical protein
MFGPSVGTWGPSPTRSLLRSFMYVLGSFRASYYLLWIARSDFDGLCMLEALILSLITAKAEFRESACRLTCFQRMNTPKHLCLGPDAPKYAQIFEFSSRTLQCYHPNQKRHSIAFIHALEACGLIRTVLLANGGGRQNGRRLLLSLTNSTLRLTI